MLACPCSRPRQGCWAVLNGTLCDAVGAVFVAEGRDGCGLSVAV